MIQYQDHLLWCLTGNTLCDMQVDMNHHVWWLQLRDANFICNRIIVCCLLAFYQYNGYRRSAEIYITEVTPLYIHTLHPTAVEGVVIPDICFRHIHRGLTDSATALICRVSQSYFVRLPFGQFVK